MSYRVASDDVVFALHQAMQLMERVAKTPPLQILPDDDLLNAVIEEAGKFAEQRIAPLNRIGDTIGPHFEHGHVTMPAGWREVYTDWQSAGWNSLSAPEAYEGQGLPHLLEAACVEMWNAAALGFGIGPILTAGAIEAVATHGTPALKEIFLKPLVSGAWMGTMNLTEPQAGSDLAAVRTKATPMGDGRYRLFGQKIFITYGEHDLTPNIVHLVLARLDGAPAGTKGLSLFLVPKFLQDAHGAWTLRNDVVASGMEHKMGLHGSPTCTMSYGEQGGAIGFLIGEENRGLACMFTMMNHARLCVGLQGVAVAERATQQALAFAKQRLQGRAMLAGAASTSASVPILHHPDVARMALTMRSKTTLARALCYQLAALLDMARLGRTAEDQQQAGALAALLTPLAKAMATDIGFEVASLGVQIHGGMGYIEDTGAAQHLRDARIFQIYEGTNGIQAIDLVMRKITLNGGQTLALMQQEALAITQRLRTLDCTVCAHMAVSLEEAISAWQQASQWLQEAVTATPDKALAGANSYMQLMGLTWGSASVCQQVYALKTQEVTHPSPDYLPQLMAQAAFCTSQLLPTMSGLAHIILSGADAVLTPHVLTME